MTLEFGCFQDQDQLSQTDWAMWASMRDALKGSCIWGRANMSRKQNYEEQVLNSKVSHRSTGRWTSLLDEEPNSFIFFPSPMSCLFEWSFPTTKKEVGVHETQGAWDAVDWRNAVKCLWHKTGDKTISFLDGSLMLAIPLSPCTLRELAAVSLSKLSSAKPSTSSFIQTTVLFCACIIELCFQHSPLSFHRALSPLQFQVETMISTLLCLCSEDVSRLASLFNPHEEPLSSPTSEFTPPI